MLGTYEGVNIRIRLGRRRHWFDLPWCDDAISRDDGNEKDPLIGDCPEKSADSGPEDHRVRGPGPRMIVTRSIYPDYTGGLRLE